MPFRLRIAQISGYPRAHVRSRDRLRSRESWSQRYPKNERTSLTDGASHLDASVMRLNNMFHKRQAQTGAPDGVCFSCPHTIELFEYASLFFGRDPDAMIRHSNHGVTVVRFECHLNLTRA